MSDCSKKTLAYVNLENPEEGEDRNVTRITRQSKWDISCVQFNPHASHAYLFVTAVSPLLPLLGGGGVGELLLFYGISCLEGGSCCLSMWGRGKLLPF